MIVFKGKPFEVILSDVFVIKLTSVTQTIIINFVHLLKEYYEK
ncbi:MAG: hypothetical protein ACLR2D_02205 [Anaerobutyricum hallii]